MQNCDVLAKGLGIVSPAHFDFPRKIKETIPLPDQTLYHDCLDWYIWYIDILRDMCIAINS